MQEREQPKAAGGGQNILGFLHSWNLCGKSGRNRDHRKKISHLKVLSDDRSIGCGIGRKFNLRETSWSILRRGDGRKGKAEEGRN